MRGTLPTVSVLIPVRNGEREIRHTIRNILRSDYPADRLEIVIGDHGSVDGTRRILESEFKGANLRIVDVPWTSPNRASVRNRLIAASESDILVFLDHDILVGRGTIRRHARIQSDHPRALVAGLTYGKQLINRDLGESMAGIDLDDIEAGMAELFRHPDLQDHRVVSGMVSCDGDIGAPADPEVGFRCFWTCNLSVKRRDIETVGLFDEDFVGWGLEDDEFAYRFQLQGYQMVFSTQAWGFHIPHPSDSIGNFLSWKRNVKVFAGKHRCRKTEVFTHYSQNHGVGSRKMAGFLDLLRKTGIPGKLGGIHLERLPAPGRRGSLFLADPAIARRLALTDAFNPWLPSDHPGGREDGIRTWSYFGIRTHFAEHEFSEFILHLEALLLLDATHLGLVLVETARISRSILVLSTPQDMFQELDYAEFGRMAKAVLGDRCRVMVTSASTGIGNDGN